MSPFEETMALAVQLPFDQRERLARALGLKIETKATLPMAAPARPDPVEWRKAERGHAVLATDLTPQGQIAPGPTALRGLWPDFPAQNSPAPLRVAALPKGTPVLAHTSAVLGLARGENEEFWAAPNVEIRLATATYLFLLENCCDEAERCHIRAFVQPFAVLSLGPMASSKAAELMLEGHENLTALDALIAATALAHEIPLVTLNAAPFLGIGGLQVAGI